MIIYIRNYTNMHIHTHGHAHYVYALSARWLIRLLQICSLERHTHTHTLTYDCNHPHIHAWKDFRYSNFIGPMLREGHIKWALLVCLSGWLAGWLAGWPRFIWKPPLRIFMIFCMKLHIDNRKRVKTCFFQKKVVSLKKTWVFLVKRSSDFERPYLGLLVLKVSSKSLQPISRYATVFELSSFFVSKFKIFFSKSPNGWIRKVKWLESKSEHFSQNQPTTGGSDAQWKVKSRFWVILLT